jgi:hypothetical protein
MQKLYQMIYIIKPPETKNSFFRMIIKKIGKILDLLLIINTNYSHIVLDYI